MISMKKCLNLLACLLVCVLLVGCGAADGSTGTQIAATTLPVYSITSALCEGTDLTVTRLVTESVSCLHDYSLSVNQMKTIEGAEMVVLSGAGLEDFMHDALEKAALVVDSSVNVPLMEGGHHHEEEADANHDSHDHEHDPHIWLAPENGRLMAQAICDALAAQYPDHADTFRTNLEALNVRFDELSAYAAEQLSDLSSREIITFHDGFGYMAKAYGLTILRSIEEESGSEASAEELHEIIDLVNEHHVKAIFTEENGSDSAAKVITSETGVPAYTLTTCMSGDDYFAAMYRNIDTLKEALK